MLGLNSILQPKHVLYKFGLPSSKRNILLPKNSSISDEPNIPAGSNNNLHEKRLPKASFALTQHLLQVIMLLPFYLQIIPYSSTEIAVKEQMNPIFIHPRWTKHTSIILSHIPMSPPQQVSGVQSINQQ
jgi:hypothetical protein